MKVLIQIPTRISAPLPPSNTTFECFILTALTNSLERFTHCTLQDYLEGALC